MIKTELYHMLDSLLSVNESEINTMEYWQSLAYLVYCNNFILHNEDENFTNKLLDLIQHSNQFLDDVSKSCQCCHSQQPNGVEENLQYIRYAVDPWPVNNRNIFTEFFPNAFMKTFSM